MRHRCTSPGRPGNRSAAIRVPAKRGRSTRIELRTPDPTANPYLALACMLEAGLSGIRDAQTPPEPVNRNIYDLTEAESAELGIKSLPHDLTKAIDALEADAVMQVGARRPHLHRVHPAQARGVGAVQRAGAPVGARPVHG